MIHSNELLQALRQRRLARMSASASVENGELVLLLDAVDRETILALLAERRTDGQPS